MEIYGGLVDVLLALFLRFALVINTLMVDWTSKTKVQFALGLCLS